MIPSLIPSDPIDTYRFDYNQLAAFMLMKSIYIFNKKRRLFVKKRFISIQYITIDGQDRHTKVVIQAHTKHMIVK